jgi:hypothetical protein
VPVHATKAYRGSMKVNVQYHVPTTLAPYSLNRDWLDPRDGLDVFKKEKSLAPTGIRAPGSPTRSPIYADYAIPPAINKISK